MPGREAVDTQTTMAILEAANSSATSLCGPVVSWMLAQRELTTIARRLRDSDFVDAGPTEPFVGPAYHGDQR